MDSLWFYDFSVGMMGIAEKSGYISNVFYTGGKAQRYPGFEAAETKLIQKAAVQLEEYFDGKRMEFDLALNPHGSDFQISVWKALQSIPYGETCAYINIAEMIGNPNASRAVGMANNRNPIAVIIPCHRVIGKNGSLTGYAGGISAKRYLLELEARVKNLRCIY